MRKMIGKLQDFCLKMVTEKVLHIKPVYFIVIKQLKR